MRCCFGILHSGLDFYSFRIWNVKEIGDNSITFSIHSLDGDQGYPGALDIEVTYTLTEDNAVQIDYHGVPEQDTIVNLTNHSYFNLNGHASGSIVRHTLFMKADTFTESDLQSIPTGKILSVEGTPMDFREKKEIGKDMFADYETLIIEKGYNHNWCLNNHSKFVKAAEMTADISGITLEVYTDLPGVQIYTANYVNGEIGKNGVVYEQHQGICFETQYYTNAINIEEFESPVCRAGEEYKTRTVFKFK